VRYRSQGASSVASAGADIINSKSNVAYCNFAGISLNAICTVLSRKNRSVFFQDET